MRWVLYSIAALISITLAADAEIEKVFVQWKGLTCNQTCMQMLYQQFSVTPGVVSVAIHPELQMAELLWNPAVPFSYQAVKYPVQRVGPGIQNVGVRVRGTVQLINNQFWLISSGDNTAFLLLGSTLAQPLGVSHSYSRLYQPFDQPTQTLLVQAVQQGFGIIIEGALMTPERSPPFVLTITKLQVIQS